ncbi:SLAM family member 6-like [Colossoma macropomum]|uniref:SLAM family member 6-like n=1 Tax=Colossoma macropomum TaxID=42526 RepID=UPI001863B87F|nr:SLAM family member 6-like [Colossoma macropomum]
MAMMVQLFFVVFSLVSATVSSDVLRLVGDSVQLDIQHPVPEFEDLSWVFNRNKNVVKHYNEIKKTRQHPAYEGRVEFKEETYSLTLKNLQKTDSGLYEAKASGDNITVVAEYRLSVLDPVEAPVLTHQLNGDACNITLTCRGHDLSINSSCYNETCEEEKVTSPAGVTLSLSVNGSTIICNHSNPVSWKETVLEMRELKRLYADGRRKREETLGPASNSTVPVVVGIVVILIVAFIVRYYCRKRSTDSTQCDTIYAEVENSSAATPPFALETPSTVYRVVGKKQQPPSNGQSSQTPVPENEMTHNKPETIYATVSQPIKTVIQAKQDETTSDVRN